MARLHLALKSIKRDCCLINQVVKFGIKSATNQKREREREWNLQEDYLLSAEWECWCRQPAKWNIHLATRPRKDRPVFVATRQPTESIFHLGTPCTNPTIRERQRRNRPGIPQSARHCITHTLNHRRILFITRSSTVEQQKSRFSYQLYFYIWETAPCPSPPR